MASKYSSSYWGGVNVKGRCSFAFFSACWCSNFARSLRMSAGDLPEADLTFRSWAYLKPLVDKMLDEKTPPASCE